MATADNKPVSITLEEGFKRRRRLPLWMEPFHTLVTKKYLGTFGGAVLLLMILSAVFADVITPYDPVTQSLDQRLNPPSAQHIMGTDQLGRDVLTRILFGARTSLYVGMGVVIISVTLGTTAGVTSAYFGGKFDVVFQRLVDAVQSIPSLILLLTIISIIGPGMINVILALALRSSISESRVARSAVFSIKENQYMDAARAIGCTHLRIITNYVLPNITAPIIILASLTLGAAILAESTLSFLGWGVPPPHPTWGSMLSDEARRFMLDAPWLAIAPGMALSLSVFGINMFGDGLRDVLDPRMRGSK